MLLQEKEILQMWYIGNSGIIRKHTRNSTEENYFSFFPVAFLLLFFHIVFDFFIGNIGLVLINLWHIFFDDDVERISQTLM